MPGREKRFSLYVYWQGFDQGQSTVSFAVEPPPVLLQGKVHPSGQKANPNHQADATWQADRTR